MFRFVRRIRPFLYCGLLPYFDRKEPYDEVEPFVPYVPTTGFERIIALFKPDAQGYCSKEYTSAVQLTVGSLVLGTCYGALKQGRTSFETFMAVNEQTRFLSAYEARRKLNDYIALKSMQTGLRYGCRFAMFTGIYSFVTILVVAYRGRDGILEYILGGTLAGASFRSHLGWKAALAAGAVGGSLGTFAGTSIFMIGKMTDTTASDVRQFQYDVRARRDRDYVEFQKELPLRFEETGMLLRAHMARLKSRLGYKVDEKDLAYFVVSDDSADADSEEKRFPTPEESLKFLENITNSSGTQTSEENNVSSTNVDVSDADKVKTPP